METTSQAASHGDDQPAMETTSQPVMVRTTLQHTWVDPFVPETRVKHWKSGRLGTIQQIWMIAETSDDAWENFSSTRIRVQFDDDEVAVRRRDAFSPVEGPCLWTASQEGVEVGVYVAAPPADEAASASEVLPGDLASS